MASVDDLRNSQRNKFVVSLSWYILDGRPTANAWWIQPNVKIDTLVDQTEDLVINGIPIVMDGYTLIYIFVYY